MNVRMAIALFAHVGRPDLLVERLKIVVLLDHLALARVREIAVLLAKMQTKPVDSQLSELLLEWIGHRRSDVIDQLRRDLQHSVVQTRLVRAAIFDVVLVGIVIHAERETLP